MSDRVDLLFGGGGDPPRPRTRPIVALLALALPLDLAGVVLPTSIVGLVPTLGAWVLAQRELDRVRRGELPQEEVGALPLLHQAAGVLLGWCAVSYVIQVALVVSGTADRLVGRLADALFGAG